MSEQSRLSGLGIMVASLAVTFLGATVPGQASILAFGANGCSVNCGVYTSAGGSTDGTFALGISGTAGIIYNQLIVSLDSNPGANNTYTLTAGSGGNCISGAAGATLELSGNTLSLYGAVSSLGAVQNLSSGCNLLATIVGTSAWQVTVTGSGSAMAGTVSLIGNAASVTENATLLSDLGLVSNTSSSALIGGSISGKSSGGNGTFQSNISPTATFSLTQTATPEPYSFMLMGFGLLASVYLARRRQAVATSRS